MQGHPADRPSVDGTARRRHRDRGIRACDKRLSFSPGEVRRIVAVPVWVPFVGAAPTHGKAVIRGAGLPLIAAHTGARREEIAGLEVADLRQGEGIWGVGDA